MRCHYTVMGLCVLPKTGVETVGSPTPRVTPHVALRIGSGEVASSMGMPETNRQAQYRNQYPFLQCAQSMPCVLYESESSDELTYISENISDLLGFNHNTVIGWRSFWRDCVLDKDFSLFEEKFKE